MKQLSSYSAHSNSSRTHALPSSTHSHNTRIALYAAFLFLGVLFSTGSALAGDGNRTFNGTTDKLYIANATPNDWGSGNWAASDDYQMFVYLVGTGVTESKFFPTTQLGSGNGYGHNCVYSITPDAGTYSHIILTRGTAATFDSGKGFKAQTGNISLNTEHNYLTAFDSRSDHAGEKTWNTLNHLYITSDGSGTLYFNGSSGNIDNWIPEETSGEQNFAYFFNGKDEAWSANAENVDGNYYKITIPEGTWAGVILTRNNEDSPSEGPKWSNTWNQTGDLLFVSKNNYLSAFGNSSVSCTWSRYIPSGTTLLNSVLNDDNFLTAQAFSKGKLKMNLPAHKTIYFKIWEGNGSTGAEYGMGNSNCLISSMTNWACSNPGAYIRMNTAGEGEYTFNYSTSTHKLSVSYPDVTHPSVDYVYLIAYGDWTSPHIHFNNSSTTYNVAATDWQGQALTVGGGSTIDNQYTYKGQLYYCAAVGDYPDFNFNHDGNTKQTGDQTPTLGQRLYNNSTAWVWGEFNFTVGWKVNGSDYTTGTPSNNANFNAKVTTLPTAPADNTLNSTTNASKFMGWSTHSYGSTSGKTDDDYDDLFTTAEGSPAITANTTFYAVFAEEGAAVGTVMWSENFSSYSANDVPSGSVSTGTGRTVYNGGSVTYTCIDGADNTKGTSGTLAGGTSPELIIGNTNGSFSIAGIPTSGAKSLTLTLGRNNPNENAIVPSVSAGYSISKISSTGSNPYTYTYKITCGTSSSFTLTLSNPNKSYGNARVDNISITVNERYNNYITQDNASWARVTYDADGGSTVCESDLYLKEGFTVCATEPTKTGYDFNGWNDGSSTYAASAAYTLSEATTFTAQWSAQTYRITYHDQGGGAYSGSNSGSLVGTHTYDSETVLVAGVKTTHVFDGWYDNEDCEGVAITTIGGTDYTTDINLYAKWTPKKVLNWYVNGSLSSTSYIADGGELVLPSDPTDPVNSKTFYGWTTTEIPCETQVAPTIVSDGSKVSADVNYHAVFYTNASADDDEVMWSESWAIDDSKTTPSTKTSGASIYTGADIKYTWTDGIKSDGVTKYNTCIKNENNVGSDKPEVMIGGKGDAGGTGGNLTIRGIPKGGASQLTLSYKQNAYRLVVSIEGNGYSWTGGSDPSNYIAGTYSYDITCGSASTFSLIFSATTTSNVRVDDISVTVKSGSNRYVTDCNCKSYIPVTAKALWSEKDNWGGELPSTDTKIVLSQLVTVDIDDAQAKSIVLNHSSGNNGQIEIEAGQALVVAETLQKTTDGSTKIATSENDIVIGSTLANGTGALILGSHDGTNKATVNFAVKAKRKQVDSKKQWINQFIGTPFNDETAVLYNYYETQLYRYHPAQNGNTGNNWWSKLSGSDGMTPFLGYNLMRSKEDDHVLWMQGTLVGSSDVTLSVENEKLYYNGSSKTENLLANSWIAPIHIGAFTNDDFTNVEKTIYIFNAGTPEEQGSHSTADGSASNNTAGQYIVLPINSAEWTNPIIKVIPAMQAFSVFATGSDASLTLDYSKLVLDPALDSIASSKGIGVVPTRAPKRTLEEAPEVIKLRIAAESGYAAQAYILGREDFTEGFDDGWDGRFMEGDEAAPQLYAPSADGKMVISCVPDIEGTVLNFRKGTKDAAYTVSFDYNGDEEWYLNDQKTNQATLIDKNNTYPFNAADTDNEARFVISKTPIAHTPTSIDDIPIDRVRKILINDHIYIVRAGRMYDITGKRVQTIK